LIASLIANLKGAGDGWSSPVLTLASSAPILLAALSRICPLPQATSQTLMDNKAFSFSDILSDDFSLSSII
jgi:hypothetical protein